MRRTKSSRAGILVLLIAIMLAPTGILLAEDVAPQDAANLLENPDFEGEYVAHDDVGDVKVAPDWTPWWVLGSDSDQEDGFGRRPSFYWSSEDTDPGGTKSGTYAQFWKHTWGQGAGGVYQTVTVPDNSRLRLAVWGRSFTCNEETIEDDCIPDDDAWMGLQIAIDPKGGTDFYADSIVFSPAINSTANDWQEFVLEADVCSSTTATVFMMYHPDFPRTQNKVYWDNASLIVIGSASDCSGESSGDGEAAAPAPAEVAFVTPQPPQADGSIVHTVSSGETLSSIAVAYYNQGYTDITVPKIKELNNLPSDIIYVGQKLTIVGAGGAQGAPAPEATEEPAEEEATEEEAAEETETEEETSSEEETEVADTTTGEVCMSLFDDANANTLRDADENLLAGGSLDISNATGIVESHTTDGVSEPHCFPALSPGEYTAAAAAPAGFEMTTVSSWAIQVDPGAKLELTFGAVGTGEAPAEEGATGGEEGAEEEGEGGGLFSNAGRVLLGVSGLLVLAVAGGLGAYFLIFRRSS